MNKQKYGVLILEGNWGEEDKNYLTDSRSTARFYTALEDILSIERTPIKFIGRPLLSCRFTQDITDFVSLTKRQSGGTVIILSAHGTRRKTITGRRRRVLQALDGKLNLSIEIKKVGNVLGKTILVLDSCEIGEGISAFQNSANALAVVGFKRTVDWLDSTLFVLAFLYNLISYGYFSKKTGIEKVAKKAIRSMRESPYDRLVDKLQVEFSSF